MEIHLSFHAYKLSQTSLFLHLQQCALCMFSPRKLLQKTFDLVVDVEEFDSKDAANLKLLERPELGVTFTKLNCWKLVQFTKCVFLDADTLVIQNSDELFDREEFSAAPDAGWPDCFNSGVFVFVPSHKTYEVSANTLVNKATLPNFGIHDVYSGAPFK